MAQVVEIHAQEMQEPRFFMVINTSVDGLVMQVSKAPAGIIWTEYYFAGWETSARQCEWKFGRASGKQDWASGILYRLYKRLPSSGECQNFLVSQPVLHFWRYKCFCKSNGFSLILLKIHGIAFNGVLLII